MQDPRRYVQMMTFIRAKIANGTYKPGELMPHINTLSQQTGHSRHTISHALRLLQDEGLVTRTPGLGYCPSPSATTPGTTPGSDATVGARTANATPTGGPTANSSRPNPISAVNGHVRTVEWGRGGAARGER